MESTSSETYEYYRRGSAEHLEEAIAVNDETFALEMYKKAFPDDVIKHFQFYSRTHEGLVCEVNHQFIVKIPCTSKGVRGIQVAKKVTDAIRHKTKLELPDITLHSVPEMVVKYPKLSGQKFDRKWYSTLSENIKQLLAKQMAEFLAMLHSSSLQHDEVHDVPLAPSWELPLTTIKQQLQSKTAPAIKATLSVVLNNQQRLTVPETSLVLGHFDLHGSNFLINQKNPSINGIIDFSNCKVGDVHQEFAVLNLCSRDFARRVLAVYQEITKRSLNYLLIQHYTTLLYLHFLATTDAEGHVDEYDQWLISFSRWYDLLVEERVNLRLKKQCSLTPVSDTIRQWLASQLMRGVPASVIHQKLTVKGYSDIDIWSEIKAAQQHPYIKAGRNIAQVLDKRNWLLQASNEAARLDNRYDGVIEVRKTPAFDIFIRDYYSKQLPVVLTDGAEHWPALKKWTPEYLIEKAGNAEVEYQNQYSAEQHGERVSISAYIEAILRGDEASDDYAIARNNQKTWIGIENIYDDLGDFGSPSNAGRGYRKKGNIKTATILSVEPEGAVVPIHYEAFNIMLVQIYGKTKITLIPSFQVPNMYNDSEGNSQASYPDYDDSKYPLLNNVSAMEVILNPGDAVFIPVAWWHKIECLDVSIGVMFSDFNV